MSEQTFTETRNNLIERAKEAATEGNQRRLILRKENGERIAETSLTVAVAVGFFLLLTGIASWPLVLVAAIVGPATKVQVEMTNKAAALEA